MKGIVYKIVYKLDTNIIYVGSTFKTLEKRFQGHLRLDWIEKKCCIVPYFNQYGRDNFEIVKIKEYDVVDTRHLRVYELLWIKKLKSINKKMPFSIYKMYRKWYYLNNKNQIIAKEKKRYENNRKIVCDNNKLNRIKHKEQKTYFCEKCNYTADSNYKLNRHFTSKKHNQN